MVSPSIEPGKDPGKAKITGTVGSYDVRIYTGGIGWHCSICVQVWTLSYMILVVEAALGRCCRKSSGKCQQCLDNVQIY